MSFFNRPAAKARNAAVALLCAGAAAMAYAQMADATSPMQGMHDMQGMHGKSGQGMAGPAANGHQRMMEMHHGDGGHGMAGMSARRQAALKAKLKLSAEQEAGWTAYVAALSGRGSAPMAMMGMMGMTSEDQAALAKLTTPERIDRMREMRNKHHEAMQQAMDKRDDATKAFYGALTAEQKAVFDAETLQRAPRPVRHGPRS